MVGGRKKCGCWPRSVYDLSAKWVGSEGMKQPPWADCEAFTWNTHLKRDSVAVEERYMRETVKNWFKCVCLSWYHLAKMWIVRIRAFRSHLAEVGAAKTGKWQPREGSNGLLYDSLFLWKLFINNLTFKVPNERNFWMWKVEGKGRRDHWQIASEMLGKNSSNVYAAAWGKWSWSLYI